VKLLLDTHIWLWISLDPKKLSPRLEDVLRNSSNEAWLSPISIWELFLLVDKGRVQLDLAPEEWITRAFRAAPLKEAPLTREVAMATHTIRLPHRDPADLFLAATAKVFDLTLVTADTRLLAVEGLSTFSNL
jgi:PIN domain nuclease of toxin-antitoxin system